MNPASGLREFFAPLPLLAVAVMAVNDFWLKPAFHNALTGKLSDVAICFFLPLYLSALLSLVRVPRPARLWAGAALTFAVYTLLNTSHTFARAFEAALAMVGRPLGFSGFRATVDPTDLWVLPVIGLALWYALGATRGEGSDRLSAAGRRSGW